VADRDSSAYHADRREYVDEFLAYHSHISRALTEERTSLESKLIPVSAYIVVSCIEALLRYPDMMRRIDEAMPADEIGRRARRPGCRVNTVHLWSISNLPLVGRKVLELVDMTMVAQLVWVVALAGVSLFVTTGHFDSKDMKKPDWLDHVNTYNLKLKLAFAIISISGVHALKTYLSGELSLENIQIVAMVAVIHFTFVLSAIGISFAERLTREHP
jgi:uncharacterized protein (TIGR00645 family)